MAELVRQTLEVISSETIVIPQNMIVRGSTGALEREERIRQTDRQTERMKKWIALSA